MSWPACQKCQTPFVMRMVNGEPWLESACGCVVPTYRDIASTDSDTRRGAEPTR